MPVNSTHEEYDAAVPGWIRARDLLAGEAAVKAGGKKYLPGLESQSEEDYLEYQSRACFFNATRRAADAFVGLVFRKAPFVRIPEVRAAPGNGGNGSALSAKAPYQSGMARVMAEFCNDADMLGTSLFGYAKNVVREVVSVGRAGTLVDWQGGGTTRLQGRTEERAYAVV